MKNKMMEQDVENMGIMAGFKDMMEMEDDDMEDTNEEDRVASEVMGRSPKSPEILMNNLRGDMRSVEARIDELADMVGYRAAKDTPQEVLALLQPVLAQQQGIGAAPASAELMQGPQPPMAPPPGMPPMMAGGAPPMPPGGAPEGMPPELMAMMAGGPQGMAGPPPPETGGIAGAPPVAMARGGYVQNFQAGSTEDGVTPVETVPGEKEEPLLKYPTDMVAAAKQGVQELIARQPATIPDLGALARQREPAYRTILGDTRGASEAQMLFSLGQRAFNFGANVDDQGRPLRGSFVSRMAGAVRTLPQDMMARVAEIDKGERAIKLAALQASEKDIDQLQSANNELTKQKRALFGDIIKSEARIEAEKQKNLNKPPKGPFGSGVTGETLNIFTKLAPDYAAGKLDPEQDRVFLAAVTNYTQPQERVEERTDPVTGNKSYVTIQTRPELPSFVRSALQLRGTALPNVPSPAVPGGGKPGAKAPAAPAAAGDISGAPGTVPADIPAEAKDAYVALKTPKDQKTLWNQRGLVAGPVQYIKTMPVLRVFGQVDAKADEARTFFDSARRSLIKALAANPRYPVSEMQAIEKEIDIAPAFFDNPNSLGNRLIGIEDFLNQRLKAAEKDANNPDFPVASRQAALDEIKELKNFNKVAGIPPRVYTIEEVQALPSGTNFLWNGRESKWKK